MAALLQSAPGVRLVMARKLIASLPDFGRPNCRRLAGLLGLASFNRDNGWMRGRRTTCGSQSDLRAALYTALLVASNRSRKLRRFYQRLIGATFLYCPTMSA